MIVAAGCAGPGRAAVDAGANRRPVDHLVGEFVDAVTEHDPVLATALGVHSRDHELPPVDARDLDAYARALRAVHARARAAAPTSREEDLDRRGLCALLERILFTLERQALEQTNPLTWVQGTGRAVLPLLLHDHPPARQRERGVVERCRAVPAYLESARELLRPGDVPPPWAEVAVRSAGRTAAFFRDQVGQAVPAAGEVAAAAGAAIERFGAWVADAVLPVARGSHAVGEASFEHLLRAGHLLDLGAAELEQRGTSLVRRFEAALAEAAGGVPWSAELDRIRQRHPSRDALVDTYAAEIERLRRYCLEADVVPDPDIRAAVRPTPEFLAPVIGYAAYLTQGPFDDVRTGTIWVTAPATDDGLRDHAYAAIPVIAAHEGYPGHHLQMCAAARLLAPIRRLPVSPLTIEGWGVYAEELMGEIGYYRPDERLFQLWLSLLRALRIVIDVGLHTGELQFEDASQILVGRLGMATETAASEVVRYTMEPADSSMYLLGSEAITHMRDEWLAATGGTLRDFHEALLAYGHLPPALTHEALTAARSAATSRASGSPSGAR